jgi:hypothetical protein
MSLLDSYVADTGEITRPTGNRPTVHPFHLPPTPVDAEPIERTAFALVGTSGEHPIAIVDEPDVSLAETAKVYLPVTYGKPVKEPEPARPWFYTGIRRWTRSRAQLVAATWPGGVA